MTNRKSYTGFPTSHQPRFYAAPNFLKMGMNQIPKFVVFHTSFDNKGREVCCKVSLYKNSQRQSCSALLPFKWLASILKLAARCPVSGCWPSCKVYLTACELVIGCDRTKIRAIGFNEIEVHNTIAYFFRHKNVQNFKICTLFFIIT